MGAFFIHFVSLLVRLLFLLLLLLLPLFKSTSTTCRMEHHGVRIIAPPFLKVAKEPLPSNYLNIYI